MSDIYQTVMPAIVIGIVIYRFLRVTLGLPRTINVPPSQAAVLFRNQEPKKILYSGTHWIVGHPNFITCDLRPHTYEMVVEDILTDDDCVMQIHLSGDYAVVDPIAFVQQTATPFATMQAELRDAVQRAASELSLQMIIEQKELLSRVRELAEPHAATLGISFRIRVTRAHVLRDSTN